MPLQGILNTARSLEYYTRKTEITSNNLANANTDAFKADRLMAHTIGATTFPVPIQDIDLRQGTMRETARPLDLSLDGDGFFVVSTPQGDRLTRGGSLRLDAAGRLTNTEGNPVQGTEGPLVLQGGTVEVHGDGTVLVDGATAGHLRVVNVQEPGRLLKEGYGRYVPTSPLRPADPATTRVRQGAVEEPNFDPLLAMVDLVTVQRAFATNIEALHVMDGALGSITNEVPKA